MLLTNLVRRVACILFLFILIAGCETQTVPPPAPRPVSALTLAETDPGRFERVTGTVASWKTDQLGFEVEGRVEFVIEPETDIAGQVYDTQGNVLTEGTLLARLDPTRYELAVESAKAQVLVAQKERQAAMIEYERVIPAETEAATARRDLGKIELDRNTELAAQNAGAQRNVDLSTSVLRQREAELLRLEASREAKSSEVASIDARIQELEESRKSSERDLADCKLYSSFAGQVADVHVVAGSVVQKGEAVVTIQMMDPIKVEVEVAPTTARRLNHRDQVTVHIPRLDGGTRQQTAFIYRIDPVADPETRTFTITLMMRNLKLQVPVPESLRGKPVARAGLVGKVIDDLPGIAEGFFVDEKMLLKDENGHYLLRVLNRRIGTSDSEQDAILTVEPVRVTPGDLSLSFLGLAAMRDITFDDPSQVDPTVDIFAGDMTLPDGQQSWNGDKLLYDRHRWLVRPGDMVGVDQSRTPIPVGIYVPLDAILEESGSYFVFAVDASPDGDTARRVEITVHETSGTLRRIEAASGQQLEPGTTIVASGAAFLSDGEPINVAREVEVTQ